MSSQRLLPIAFVGAVGVLSGVYIWKQPMQELSGKAPLSQPVSEGRSQSAKDGSNKDGSPSSSGPHPALKWGGASPVDRSAPTVAGTSPDSRKGYSADHQIKTRDDPTQHDGTGGGGVGVAEMRERKEKGQGLPSPQGGDTPAKPVGAVAHDGEGGGIPNKKGRWWLGGW